MFLVGAIFSFSSVIVRRKRNTCNNKPLKKHIYRNCFSKKSRCKMTTKTSSTSAAWPSRYFFIVPPTSGKINLLPSSNILSHTNTLEGGLGEYFLSDINPLLSTIPQSHCIGWACEWCSRRHQARSTCQQRRATGCCLQWRRGRPPPCRRVCPSEAGSPEG